MKKRYTTAVRDSGFFLPLGILITFSLIGCATVSRSSFFQAREELRAAGHQQKNSSLSIGLYLSAAQKALAVITDKNTSLQQQAECTKIYNDAVGECVIALKEKYSQTEEKNLVFRGGGEVYKLDEFPAETINKFTRFILSSKIDRDGFRSNVEREGIGCSLVAVQKTGSWNEPVRGFATPLTAVANFGHKTSAGDTSVRLAFFDPRDKETVIIGKEEFPLRADFTAPLAFFSIKRKRFFGFLTMVFPEGYGKMAGLYFQEPYDPQKIPVVFIHGLLSSTHDWFDFINELNKDPYFRKHYQVWGFFYPAGMPILGSSLLLRNFFATAIRKNHLKKDIILIGHSAGGVIARMQVVNSGDLLWHFIFGPDVKKVKKDIGDSALKNILSFKANPYISRVIFIESPHRGSDLAIRPIAFIGSLLTATPSIFLKKYDATIRSLLQKYGINQKFLLGSSVPTSINNLAPNAMLAKTVDAMAITVPYYSIIGNRGEKNKPLEKSSDGVVPYWSSHLEGAASEYIIPVDHAHANCPESVAETLRILKIKSEN
ncbi:MAG: esterase/lipase family protein [Chthoniobacterales bacterium]